jgi:TRAP-type uncharacterized transport system fused permease subunit
VPRGKWREAGELGLAAVIWVVVFHESLDQQYGMLAGPGQHAAAALPLLTVLAMARRAIGPVLPAVALLALAYGFFGDLLPGRFGHAGIPTASLLGNPTIAEAGIRGPLTGVSAGIVAAFVILGALLSAGEAGAGFVALAVTLAGGLGAGAAKVAVLASDLFGSLSGSASANVASTGAVTLPMMKRLGYPRPSPPRSRRWPRRAGRSCRRSWAPAPSSWSSSCAFPTRGSWRRRCCRRCCSSSPAGSGSI